MRVQKNYSDTDAAAAGAVAGAVAGAAAGAAAAASAAASVFTTTNVGCLPNCTAN